MTALIRILFGPKPIDWGARLQQMVDEKKNSFEVRDFAKRRAASLKGKGRKPRITVLGGGF